MVTTSKRRSSQKSGSEGARSEVSPAVESPPAEKRVGPGVVKRPKAIAAERAEAALPPSSPAGELVFRRR